jgi:hypothetical protein
MTPRFTSALIFALASSTVLLAAPARAADTKDTKKADPAVKADAAPAAKDAPAADAPAGDAPADAPAVDDAAGTEGKDKAPSKDSSMVADAEAGSSPVELPGQTYYGIGLRYRAIIIPKFMMNLFGDGGRTVLVHGIGPEFTIRKNAFEYNLSTWFASYSMDPTPFKAKSDGADAWELVESNLKILYLTADFMWSQDLAPEFAFNYGVGAGFGFVWGDLKRDQATQINGQPFNPGTGEGYVKCAGPNTTGPNCFDGKHYGYLEPSWANGGSKPVIFPWLTLQTGLRYKPHRNVIARLDAGFGTSGFFLGLGIDYGL